MGGSGNGRLTGVQWSDTEEAESHSGRPEAYRRGRQAALGGAEKGCNGKVAEHSTAPTASGRCSAEFLHARLSTRLVYIRLDRTVKVLARSILLSDIQRR